MLTCYRMEIIPDRPVHHHGPVVPLDRDHMLAPYRRLSGKLCGIYTVPPGK